MNDDTKFAVTAILSVLIFMILLIAINLTSDYKKLELTSTMNPQAVCFSKAATNTQFEICKSMTPQ
jgi:hypothetical protein